MGFFDFLPVHGGGSGSDKNTLDEQWETQQAILAARRGHIDKEHLKQKYAGGEEARTQKQIQDKSSTRKNINVVSETWSEDSASSSKEKKFKFFWEK